jgi:hypothetical protein
MTGEQLDFISKLNQIEEQANAFSAELGPGLAKARLQHIVMLARALRGRLEFGGCSIVRAGPELPLPGSPHKPPA